jgi:Holliday junction resolvase RusA-like endonuclease
VKLFIDVLGTPAPQGSKRAFAVRKGGVPTGRVAVVEQQDKRIKSWRQAVVEAARAQVPEGSWFTAPDAHGNPVGLLLSVTFYVARPRSHYRTGRNADVLKPSAPLFPARMPDLSKLVRATEDALTDAGIWADDGQIVTTESAKRWAEGRRLPGARIDISTY